jgi:hypothetical protein
MAVCARAVDIGARTFGLCMGGVGDDGESSREIRPRVAKFGSNPMSAARPLGLGNGEIVEGFHGSGRCGLVTSPSPRSLSANSNRPRQRNKKASASRGRSPSRGAEVETIDRGAEKESSTTSMHPSRSVLYHIPPGRLW